MSKKINIEGIMDVSDPFYRYTMTKLNVVRQKNKTVIDNLDLVCKDLERDPKLLIDFYKKKFSVSMIFKEGVLSTSADIAYDRFYSALREFIEYYVLCEQCKLPETIIDVKDNKMMLNCKCCSKVTIKTLKK
ncbi:eukaryotic translation initiation factor eIF-2 beta [Fadolivirus algeromassiliense]|jgi:translation initiation factor 5|uniref:Eukaryotic translation initiation factor eIF-2 beta n=1 Tax=Fadolivirus FV1/VV64 TaxID=3070911 RepID=A0A7D3V8V8_9VIRU|nr:eukaryotic translation initiation factor eIF-2 beta [Fadolivirus algeromassiliense]QKF94117.1 eukaryotic translation initiation factor eIF-2 beta [Fadolivirus FV1/VV64]